MSQLALADAFAPSAAVLTDADFAVIVRENQTTVFSIAYNFLRDAGQAEELAQDVFLQLYRNLGRIESREHAANWLRRAACHRAIDCTRKRAAAREVGLESAPEPSSEPSARDPFLREHLRKLIASLPARKRLLVILRYQEEMEMDEIAAAMKMPARTVRTQLWRTMAHLREKAAHLLGEAGPAPGTSAKGARQP